MKIYNILFFLFITSCSTVFNKINKPEYTSKMDEIRILNNENEKKKIFISSTICEVENCLNLKDKISQNISNFNSNYIITENFKEADYIIKINLDLFSTDVDYNVAEKIKYYLLFNNISNSFYSDGNNSPRYFNDKNFFDVTVKSFKSEEENASNLFANNKEITAIGIGMSAGYLIAKSITGLIAGGLITVPIFYGAKYATKNVGTVAIFDLNILEKQTQNVQITQKAILKKASNNIQDITPVQYTNNYLPLNSKIIIIGIGSRYSTESIQDNIFEILTRKITNIFT